jgi:epsilon-lactone hydrolase
LPSAKHESTVAAITAAGMVLTPTEAPSAESLRILRNAEADAAQAASGRSAVSVQLHAGIECVAITNLPAYRTAIYCHGGGYVYTRAADAGESLTVLARRCEMNVVAPDYRRAPEYRFPAAVDDVLAVYESLLAQGLDSSGIVFAGDSAGGGLAIATLLAAQRAGLPTPMAGVLFSPWTDLTVSGQSAGEANDPIVNAAGLKMMAALYLDDADPRDPLASPLYAEPDEYAALPPLLVQVGTREALLDDSRRFVARARESGCNARYVEHAEVVHMWIIINPALPESARAFDIAADFLAELDGHDPVNEAPGKRRCSPPANA